MNSLPLDIQVNEKILESVWHGPAPKDAPTLIFLHEGLGSVSMWKDFPQKLSRQTGCGALVYSRLGYGKSESLDEGTIERLIKELNEARRDKNFDLADSIRHQLKEKGIEIEDTSDGTVWRSN